MDHEGCSRRENVRIHGVKEGVEDSAKSMVEFVEVLLRKKLDLPPSLHIQIERSHRAGITPSPGFTAEIHCGEICEL